MGKPFTIKDTGTGRAPPQRVISPAPEAVAAGAKRDNEKLGESLREMSAPDYAVGSKTPAEAAKGDGSGEKQLPAYPKEATWPELKLRAPMKLG